MIARATNPSGGPRRYVKASAEIFCLAYRTAISKPVDWKSCSRSCGCPLRPSMRSILTAGTPPQRSGLRRVLGRQAAQGSRIPCTLHGTFSKLGWPREVMNFRSGCLLWGRSGHCGPLWPYPLCPQERTNSEAVGLSAWCPEADKRVQANVIDRAFIRPQNLL